MVGMVLLIAAVIFFAAAFFLPQRRPWNQILAAIGAVCAVLGLILVAAGAVVVQRDLGYALAVLT
jgi:uncharacterized BrkB/YihY/UPF0761 family membrane protein